MYTTQGFMTPADMADLADLYDWRADEEDTEADTDPECEARGCDIRPDDTECRRCGAEVVE